MIRVRDYGRGVPFGIREDGENVVVYLLRAILVDLVMRL